jgi:hypothetical protein
MDFSLTFDEIKALLSAISHNWVTGMTSVFGLIATICGVVFYTARFGRIFLLVGLLALFIAPVYAWRDERRARIRDSARAIALSVLQHEGYKRMNEWWTICEKPEEWKKARDAAEDWRKRVEKELSAFSQIDGPKGGGR